MHAMLAEPSAHTSQFRVTLFVGPQHVEGKPFTHATVFNVKKRSWKGGIQVTVQIDQPQIEATSFATGFPQWLAEALAAVSEEDRLTYQDRAQELFIQAVCWCKLDLLLQSGITQENQCLASDTYAAELQKVATTRCAFITSHIASELDLRLNDAAPSS
ncbi:hypothetical protein [Petrachloros mirabilis]